MSQVGSTRNTERKRRCRKTAREELHHRFHFVFDGLAGDGPRPRWWRRFRLGLGRRRAFHDQVHHDIAFETNDLAAVDDPEPVGGERTVQQFDVDMLVRRHRSLVDVDIGLRQPGLITGGGLQEDVLAQVQHLLLAVEKSGARIHRHRALVLHHDLGAQRPEFDVIGVGQILDRRLGPHFVGTLVGRETRKVRRFHGDLGAGHHEIADVDGQLASADRNGFTKTWISDDTGQRQHHGRRDRHPQHPHHPAMAGGRGKAGLHSGDIGWVLYRVHRGSKGRQGTPRASKAHSTRNRRIMQPEHAR